MVSLALARPKSSREASLTVEYGPSSYKVWKARRKQLILPREILRQFRVGSSGVAAPRGEGFLPTSSERPEIDCANRRNEVLARDLSDNLTQYKRALLLE